MKKTPSYDKMKVMGIAMDETELIQWNKRMNKELPMLLLERHPNPLIRYAIYRRDQLLYSLGDWTGKVAADIGCHHGSLSQKICREARVLYCVDIDDEMLENVKKTLAGQENVRFVANNIENLKDIPSDAIDIAVSACVLPHVPSPEKALRELVRIVKNHGTIILNSTHDSLNLKFKRVAHYLGLSFLFPHITMGLSEGHIHEASLPFHLNLIQRVGSLQVERKFLAPMGTFIFIVCRVEKK